MSKNVDNRDQEDLNDVEAHENMALARVALLEAALNFVAVGPDEKESAQTELEIAARQFAATELLTVSYEISKDKAANRGDDPNPMVS
jgi:hypothetical protein